MDENESLARTICQQLEPGSPLVLASIVSVMGSSPRHRGTKMVVGADGKGYGTIGGGLPEALIIKEARAVLAIGQSRIMSLDLTGTNANAPGMICGGRADVLLDYVTASKDNRAFFKQWLDAVLNGKDFFYLTHLKENRDTVNIIGRSLLFPDGRLLGNPLSKSEMENLRTELHNISATTVFSTQDFRTVVDPIRKLKTLYCFGAGHVAVPTAHVAALAGFRVVVVDDRAEYANAERFPDAYDIRVIDDFNQALAGLEIDSDSFIVILTRGHQYDRIVLEQALKTKAGYIGMISSRNKRDAVYKALTVKGVKKEQLERVHSPIGLAIGAETPEEIAVSIVAELISERARQQA